MKTNLKNNYGFTLVELAIVMIIIGLLIGGVLKGQQLIQNAKVSSTIAQVKGYMAAYNSFLDAYAGTPGDMANADRRLSGCDSGNSNFCIAGGGDSLVGQPATSGGGQEGLNQAGVNTLPQAETSMFWKHLALADLITGVDPTSDPTDPAWGQSHPASPFGGGFHIFYSAHAGDYGTGHNLRMQNPVNANAGSGGEGGMAVSPILARSIDLKMDDGLPDTGSVTADYAGSNCDPGGEYTSTPSRNCFMYFELD